MSMLIDCSSCRTRLQLRSGASSVSCAVCRAVTHVAAPPPAPAPSLDNGLSSFGQRVLVNGRKRAVICGVSYKRTNYVLNGSINDAKCMEYLLVNTFKFPESSILMLTEEENDPDRIPTRRNIKKAMQWLVQGCQPGDSLVFYFSGHGCQQRDPIGDEVDGYDETLCPMDFETQGMIIDDEINATIVKPIPHGVKLHAIIDACHSGTMLDLPFFCRMDRNGRYKWEDQSPPLGHYKGTNGGEVISFSGCDDHQTSVDTASLSKVTSTGAMTYAFIQAILTGHATTYGDMLTSMRTTIRKDAGEAGGGAHTSLLGMPFTRRSHGGGLKQDSQEPQLTASEPFDIFTKQFSL